MQSVWEHPIHSVGRGKRGCRLGADYLFAGNIYETDCKKGLPGRGLDFLRQVCMESSVPVYAIGGVNEERLPEILSTGAAGGCMMSGFYEAVEERSTECRRISDFSVSSVIRES